MEKTIDYIIKNNCSIARFGDGEFGIITKTNNPDFQQGNIELAHRLEEICKCRDKRLLICIPHNFKSSNDCNEFARKFWEWWIWENNNLYKVAEALELNSWKTRIFGDAQITRPYMDWKDKSNVQRRFDKLKSLWSKKHLLIIEGEKTRLGVGNDLLIGAADVQRILVPSKNAYSKYDEILAAAEEYGKDKLILLAVGPTATVLAYDLAMKNYRALDIGHIDIEYEWFLHEAEEKEAVMGKEIQEIHMEQCSLEIRDNLYFTQIIKRIGC